MNEVETKKEEQTTEQSKPNFWRRLPRAGRIAMIAAAVVAVLAAAAGLFFKLLSRRAVPNRIIFKWAFFMLGPLCALWYARLWVNIPLFSLAQVILCLIYMQQIFNTLPEEK